jgi:hypothetical protein
MNEGSYLQSFSFSTLSNRSKPSRHESSFEPNFEATRKDPDPKKIPGSSFALLNQCAKFQSEILTLSTYTLKNILVNKLKFDAATIILSIINKKFVNH